MIEKNIKIDDFLKYHKNEFKLFAQTEKGKKYYDEYHPLDSDSNFVPSVIHTTTIFHNLKEKRACNFYEYENANEDKRSHKDTTIHKEFSILSDIPLKIRDNKKKTELTDDDIQEESETFIKYKKKIIQLKYTANVKKNIERFLSGISFFLTNKIRRECSRFVHFIEEIEWFSDEIHKESTFLRIFIYPEKKETRLFFIETIITIRPCYTTTTKTPNNNNKNNNILNNNMKILMIENKKENIEFWFETKFHWDKEYNDDSQQSKNTFHHSSFLLSLFKMTYSEKKMSQFFEEELKLIFSDFCEYIRQQKNKKDNQKKK